MKQAIKIQKVLASLGLASRREIENWLKQQRIQVNGEIATIGQRIDREDKLSVDGKVIDLQPFFQSSKTKVLLYNKPLGEECSTKPSDERVSVFAKFPTLNHERWILVGRLDVNTSGLLLVTNNGELANRLMHPSYGIMREYRVRIDGALTETQLRQAKQGVKVEDFMAKFDNIEPLQKTGSRNQWYQISLQTGRNKEVRRLLNALGVQVNRLLRTRFANIPLPRSVPPGQYQYLTPKQTNELLRRVSLDGTI